MEIKEVKHNLDMICMIGISVGDTLYESLRKFVDTFKHFNLNKGESIFNSYKELEGKFFKNENQFILHNKQKGNADLTNIAVSNEEIREFLKLCKEYGVDVLYQRRPDNLEELLERQKAGEELSTNQEAILKAFSYKDSLGNIVLKDDASLICFNLNDTAIVERILDAMELRQYNIQKRAEKAKKTMEKIKKKAAKTKEKQSHSKESFKDFNKTK